MSPILRQHIQSILKDNTDGLDYVMSKFRNNYLKKKELIFEQDKECKYVYFIASGAVQIYTHDSEMQEVTRDILTEGSWFSDLASFSTGVNSLESARTLEDSLILTIDRDAFKEMMEKVPQFFLVYKHVIETIYAQSVIRVNSLLTLSAEEKITWIKTNKPYLLSRFSNKLIASYLGINKDVYSRILTKLNIDN